MEDCLKFLSRDAAVERMNEWSGARKPFLFFVSYDRQFTYIEQIDKINSEVVRYNFQGVTNDAYQPQVVAKAKLKKWESHPEPFEVYQHSFNIVKDNLSRGNSFLVNLTCATPVDTNLQINEIYDLTEAKYKLWVKDKFVMFSPEIFVRIIDGKIYSHPMKGTIDATLPQAESTILADKKEAAEHATITDLIRNDLSRIAHQVRVNRYRYISYLATAKGPLLQTSTEIEGTLDKPVEGNLGSLLFQLLPAGSITGAPKRKTEEIIASAEGYHRGFYTGVSGIYDGHNLDSCVMIRFIEQTANGLVYKSGGGITARSQAHSEYEEMIQKIYLPIK